MNIFVGNLSFQTTQDELHAAFAQYGNVDRVNIVTDRDTGQPRGFAFVEMPDQREAETAIQQLNGAEMNGRALNVNEARPKPAGGGFGGGGGRGGPRGGGLAAAVVDAVETGAAVVAAVDAAATKLLQSFRKFSVVIRAISSGVTPRSSASLRAVSRDERGLVALAAMRNRREIRRVGFDQNPVGGRACARLPECRRTWETSGSRRSSGGIRDRGSAAA